MNALTTLNQHYQRYFFTLFHPQENVKGSLLTLNEAIVLSWPFIIVGVITNTVFSLFLTIQVFDQKSMGLFPFIERGSLLTWPILIGLFWSLWGILLFPIRAYIYAYLLKLILGFYQRITRTYSHDPSMAMDLVSSSMSSNVFRIVPGMGDLIQSLAQFLCLFKGVRERLKISSLAAGCILLTPALLMLLFFGGIAYSFFLLIILLF